MRRVGENDAEACEEFVVLESVVGKLLTGILGTSPPIVWKGATQAESVNVGARP